MNTCVLIGRLTKDPELAVAGQTEVCKFTLAVDRYKKGEADFINIVTFGKLAEHCTNFLSKGKMAAVQGRIQTRSYENKSGQKVYVTEVIGENVQFLSPKEQSEPRAFEDATREVTLDEEIPF